jgi:hypothetical protein
MTYYILAWLFLVGTLVSGGLWFTFRSDTWEFTGKTVEVVLKDCPEFTYTKKHFEIINIQTGEREMIPSNQGPKLTMKV